MKIFRRIAIPAIAIFIIGLAGIAMTKDDVGSVVALRGKAVIEREKKDIEAKLRDVILLQDTISTKEASKAKMLFADDSVLTMGEKSKVNIKEFIYSKEKGGKSTFNLIEGKLRTVVGKTQFEVHTPSAVAAARGTIIHFESEFKPADKLASIRLAAVPFKNYVTIFCEEGEVEVKSPDPRFPDIRRLLSGMFLTAIEGQPIPLPSVAPPSLRDRMKKGTDIRMDEIEIKGPMPIGESIRIDVPPVTPTPRRFTVPPTTPPPTTPPPTTPPPTTPPPTTPPPTTPPPTTPPPTTPPPTTPPPPPVTHPTEPTPYTPEPPFIPPVPNMPPVC